MKKLYPVYLLAFFACIVFSCKQSTETSTENRLLSTYFPLRYEKISRLPIYQQSVMLNCYDDKILVYGSYDLMLFDTLSKTWQTTSIRGDSVRGRWDGAIGKINNYIYAFGAPFHMESPRHYNVMKLDVKTLALEELPEAMPNIWSSQYPAYETFEDKILIVFPRLDSVYLFNASTQKGKYVAKNEFKIPTIVTWGDLYYAFGSYNNSLYIYNKYTKELGSINLNTYSWTMISIPAEIKDIISNYINGGVFDGLLMFFSGGNGAKALCYDIKTGVWGYGNCDIRKEMVFETSYKNSTQFYFLDMPMDTLWRVTRVK